MTPEMVPNNVQELVRAWLIADECDPAELIAAALNAWPGMKLDYWSHIQGAILLPITQPQEDGDD